MIQNCSPNSDFKWSPQHPCSPQSNEILSLDFKGIVWNESLWIKPFRAGCQGLTGRQHMGLVPPEPTLTVLTTHPSLQEHLHTTKLSQKCQVFFQHLCNIIHLKCTFFLWGIRIAQSPEAFVSSEECNACRSHFSLRAEIGEAPVMDGFCLWYRFINLLHTNH